MVIRSSSDSGTYLTTSRLRFERSCRVWYRQPPNFRLSGAVHRRIEYNTERPHSSLGYLTPAQLARAHDTKQQFLTSDSNCSSDQNRGGAGQSVYRTSSCVLAASVELLLPIERVNSNRSPDGIV